MKLGSDQRARQVGRVFRATDHLTAAVLAPGDFDADGLLEDFERRGITSADLLDSCIPESARRLGQGWLDDDLSFARVSAATSRLFGLSKALASEWDNLMVSDDSLSVLVVSFRREDHLLGPGILAQQLRRRLHSVHLMSNTDADAVRARAATGEFDCVMVSVASLVNLQTAISELQALRSESDFDLPVIVGGRALDYTSTALNDIPADLVTDDLDLALAALGDMLSERAGLEAK